MNQPSHGRHVVVTDIDRTPDATVDALAPIGTATAAACPFTVTTGLREGLWTIWAATDVLETTKSTAARRAIRQRAARQRSTARCRRMPRSPGRGARSICARNLRVIAIDAVSAAAFNKGSSA